jgi:DNA polymerase epsilon subunit 1
MAEAFNREIIFPNKKIEDTSKFYKGNLLDSETYTGGKVECLRTGVYRADFTTDFTLDPRAFQELIDNVDEIVKFAVGIEMAQESFETISNIEEVREEILSRLTRLRDVKNPHKF